MSAISDSPRKTDSARMPLLPQSLVLGPQSHRLPEYVMWGIVLSTAAAMAILNLIAVFAIEYTVMAKFRAMQAVISSAGIVLGIIVLTAISVGYATIGVWLVQLAPDCGGSGLPENKCFLSGSCMPGFFTGRKLLIRILTSILANAAGFPVGREGPTVVIGSNVAYLISQSWARSYMSRMDNDYDYSSGIVHPNLIVDEERISHATRIACAVGGACGMAMIFNAPLGGLLYMFEEITSVSWPIELTFRAFVATMFCAFVSYALLNACGTDIMEFVIYAFVSQTKVWEWRDVPVVIGVSATLGVITSLHTRAMLAIAAYRGRSKWRKGKYAKVFETVFYAMLCAVVSAGASYIGECADPGGSGLRYVKFDCEEGEYNPIASLLVNTSHSSVKLLFSGENAGEIRPYNCIIAFVVYCTLNVGLTGLPVPGGAFTATMLMGGLFGRAIGGIFREMGLLRTVSGVYAVVGSAAMLCGFKQMTMAVVLIVVECVNDLSLAPIVMLSVAVSMFINRLINKRGHDEEQIERKSLPFMEGEPPRTLDIKNARSLLRGEFPPEGLLPGDAEHRRVKDALDKTDLAYFPIMEDEACIGVVARAHLETAMNVSTMQTPAGQHTPTPGTLGMVKSLSITFDDDMPDLVGLRSEKVVVGGTIPLRSIMDPTPFIVLDIMPAPRLHALFSKAREHIAVVVTRDGEFAGIISRDEVIKAGRH